MNRSKNTQNDPRQMTIEDYIARLGNADTLPKKTEKAHCDIRPQLRGIMNEIIRESGKSRIAIADEMTKSIGNGAKITEDTINSWTREIEARHIPLEYIYAFEVICENRGITEYFCKLHNGKFVDSTESDVLDLGQIQLLKTQLAIKEKQLKTNLSKGGR